MAVPHGQQFAFIKLFKAMLLPMGGIVVSVRSLVFLQAQDPSLLRLRSRNDGGAF
tara:strand:+ start:237 stop:401 length:165 start_codon:yes stop_codon:yes gene_type:complete